MKIWLKKFETKTGDEHAISEKIYKKSKQYTELYYLEKTQGCIFRSKCQIEGEKSTKFFWGWKKRMPEVGQLIC